jgi:hypothetical protein
MKNKFLLFFAIIFATVSGLRAGPLEEAATHYTSSNTVTITTNLMFFLSSQNHGGFPAMEFKSDEPLVRGIAANPLYTTGTNYMYVTYLGFPFNQTFDFHLSDDKGVEIQKTKQGVANSHLAQIPTNMSELDKLKSVIVRQNGVIIHALFRPDEMFLITNKGEYTMEIRMRICVQMTNGIPNYEVMQNLKKYPHEPYGVVVSEPLRLKVIKN